MSGGLIGGIIGASLAYFTGGMSVFMGFTIGSTIGSLLYTAGGPDQSGPRLDDLKPQESEYGRPIPIVYGTVALQGNVIWASDIVEVATTETVGDGPFGGGTDVTTYAYFGNFAVAVCDGPVDAVLRIWAGPAKRLIYDGFQLESGELRVYLGDEAQEPDPLIEQYMGAGNAPAYRGTCYVVLENFALANDGNSLPWLTIEVATDGGSRCQMYSLIGTAPNQKRVYPEPPVKIGTHDAHVMNSWHSAFIDPADKCVYYLVMTAANDWYLRWAGVQSSDVGEIELTAHSGSILYLRVAFDPNTRKALIIQNDALAFTVFHTAVRGVVASGEFDVAKTDVLYKPNYGGEQGRYSLTHAGVLELGAFVTLNYDGHEYLPYDPATYEISEWHPDSFGLPGTHFGGALIDCGDNGIAIAQGTAGTYLGGEVAAHLSNNTYQVYDSRRNRLYNLSGMNTTWWDKTAYYDFDTQAEVIPASGGDIKINTMYHAGVDRVIAMHGGGAKLYNPAQFNDDAFEVECEILGGSMVYGDLTTEVVWDAVDFQVLELPWDRLTVVVLPFGVYGGGGDVDIFKFRLGGFSNAVLLSEIVADLSDRAGMHAYDVTALTDLVDGYALARQTSVRSAIDALRPAYYFDAVESQGVVRYVKRGGAAAATIPDADLAAHLFGSDSGDPLATTRKQEVELPRTVNVKYLLAATNYEQATKTAKRLVGSSNDEVTIEAPLVLTDTKAQEVAEVNLHSAWAQRRAYTFTLPRKYAHLEPTDLIVVRGHLMRLLKVTSTPQGVIKSEAVADDAHYYAPHVNVTETPATDNSVNLPGATTWELM
jgi:hypothetical protein